MERRGPAAGGSSDNMEGKGEMIKAPINLQDLNRGIYVMAKEEFGRKRWSRRYGAESAPSKIGLITHDKKSAGKRSAGNPHAAFDVEGAGNVAMAAELRAGAKALESPTGA